MGNSLNCGSGVLLVVVRQTMGDVDHLWEFEYPYFDGQDYTIPLKTASEAFRAQIESASNMISLCHGIRYDIKLIDRSETPNGQETRKIRAVILESENL